MCQLILLANTINQLDGALLTYGIFITLDLSQPLRKLFVAGRVQGRTGESEMVPQQLPETMTGEAQKAFEEVAKFFHLPETLE
jgi:hypothetical protein